ncbi:hypothetical protein [Rhizobium oryzicola]|uniref:Uncharacterized protein n=1 Tax=Rhizobium oryzicola TaxID=1232668 RepID=A0ABT8SR46_9HYPH|nr:hypothetical protein [Rhizobium oryzicola]MDO1580907.1 hypothetical protein [Rhizobium oryzicola]
MAKPKPEVTGRLIFENMSDHDLRAQQIDTNDPKSFSGIVDHPPDPTEDLRFVARYESNNSETCAYGHLHRRGFVLENSASARFLIGKDCAADHYGLQWSRLENDVKTAAKRRGDLLWLDRAVELLLSHEQQLKEIANSPAVAAVDDLRRQIHTIPGPLLQYFQGGSDERGKMLSATYRVEDPLKQRKLIEATGDELDKAVQDGASPAVISEIRKRLQAARVTKQYTFVSRGVLRRPASNLFVQSRPLRDRLAEAVGSSLAQMNNVKVLDISGRRIDLVSKSVKEAAERIDRLLSECNEAEELFLPNVLEGLATLFDGEEFKAYNMRRIAEGFSIAYQGETIMVTRPQTLAAEDFRLSPLLKESSGL